MTLGSSATLTTASFLNNSGGWRVAGNGGSVTLGGVLINSNDARIGAVSLGASTPTPAANLSDGNGGALILRA